MTVGETLDLIARGGRYVGNVERTVSGWIVFDVDGNATEVESSYEALSTLQEYFRR